MTWPGANSGAPLSCGLGKLLPRQPSWCPPSPASPEGCVLQLPPMHPGQDAERQGRSKATAPDSPEFAAWLFFWAFWASALTLLNIFLCNMGITRPISWRSGLVRQLRVWTL